MHWEARRPAEETAERIKVGIDYGILNLTYSFRIEKKWDEEAGKKLETKNCARKCVQVQEVLVTEVEDDKHWKNASKIGWEWVTPSQTKG